MTSYSDDGSSIADAPKHNQPSAAAQNFNIQLIAADGTPDKYHEYFAKAKARWQQVIVGDVLDVPKSTTPVNGWFDGNLGTMGSGGQRIVATNEYYGNVDDIVIGYKITYIDGKNGVLGQAGSTYVRGGNVSHDASQMDIPISGTMEFDSADADELIKEGVFDQVVLHEMGHVLGIGNWPTTLNRCGSCEVKHATCGNACEPYYTSGATGACHAQQQFEKLDLGVGPNLLLETKGGISTECTHWSEEQLGNELMTGWLDGNNPLSTITIGALHDLGYQVDYSVADPFEIQTAMAALKLIEPRQNLYDRYGGVMLRLNPKRVDL